MFLLLLKSYSLNFLPNTSWFRSWSNYWCDCAYSNLWQLWLGNTNNCQTSLISTHTCIHGYTYIPQMFFICEMINKYIVLWVSFSYFSSVSHENFFFNYCNLVIPYLFIYFRFWKMLVNNVLELELFSLNEKWPSVGEGWKSFLCLSDVSMLDSQHIGLL